MSSYQKETKHPKTDRWELAWWEDNALGHRLYGVRFPSEPHKLYDPETQNLETRESAQGADKTIPTIEPSSVSYGLTYEIKCASASHQEPHVCKNRKIVAEVTVALPSGAITVRKVNADSGTDRNGASYQFINSDPSIVRAIGEILLQAASLSERHVQRD